MHPEGRCKSCGAAVHWAQNENGKWVPLDRISICYTVTPEDPLKCTRALSTFITHFQRCIGASNHSHKNKQGGAA